MPRLLSLSLKTPLALSLSLFPLGRPSSPYFLARHVRFLGLRTSGKGDAVAENALCAGMRERGGKKRRDVSNFIFEKGFLVVCFPGILVEEAFFLEARK